MSSQFLPFSQKPFHMLVRMKNIIILLKFLSSPFLFIWKIYWIAGQMLEHFDIAFTIFHNAYSGGTNIMRFERLKHEI